MTNHPIVDLDAAMQAVAERVLADPGEPGPGLALRLDPGFAVQGRGAPGTGGPADVVGTIGGHEFVAGFAHGLEAACAKVMSAMQDEIIASRAGPWPEITGAQGGVLDVALEPAGLAHWRLRGEPVCAVGRLLATCRVLGWQVG